MAYQPKSYRQFLATSVTAAAVAGGAAVVGAGEIKADDHEEVEASFDDVDEDVYYATPVLRMAEAGFIEGTGNNMFTPDRDVTRGEAASLFSRSLLWDTDEVDPVDFYDVDAEAFYHDDVAAAVELGIIEGYEDGSFRPDDNLTRGEMAVLMTRAFDLEVDNGADHTFTDLDGHPYEDYIAAIEDAGLADGYPDGTFRPDDTVTRADFATFIYEDPTIQQNVDDAIDGVEDIVIMDVTAETEAGVTTVIGNVQGDFEGEAATVTVVSDDDEEDVVEQDVEISQGGSVSAEFEDLDAGEYTATITVGDVSESTEFEIDDDLEGAIAEAEEAIDALADDITLEDRADVLEARAAVDAALEIDAEAEIEGLETLEEAESVIEDLLEDVEIDDADFTSTSSFEVEFENGVTGLTEANFDVELDGEELEFDVEANQDGTVYTFTHADLSGDEGEVTVTFGEDSEELPFDFTDEALDAAVDAVETAQDDDALLDALQEPVLNLENVNEEFVSEYADEIDDSFITGVDDIQAAIDRVNEEYADEVAELLETLNTTVSQTEFQETLEELGIEFDDDLLTEYFSAIQDAQPDSVEAVAEVIAEVEAGVALEAYDTALAEPTAENISEAEGLIELYIEDEDEQALLLEDLEELEAVATLNEYVGDDDISIEELTNDLEEFGIEGYELIEDNLDELFEEREENFTSLEEVQSFIDAESEEFATTLISELNEAFAEINDFDDLSDQEEAELVDDIEEILGEDAFSGEFDDLETFFELYGDVEFESISELREARDESRIVVSTRTAIETDDADAINTVLLDLDDNEAFIELGSTGRADVSEILVEEFDEDDISSEEDLRNALNEAIDIFEERVEAVNEATTISAMRDALDDLNVDVFDGLSEEEELELAEEFLNAFPEDEDGERIPFTAIGDIVDEIDDLENNGDNDNDDD
ncbi:S-layer homology domain-containing protein [Salsuginibacillus kocurii]|uniref:S-layer homology domain-containing protein n=1 Tax=Salsuginibacillus kocurii TaxID=427078 RepID=UPI00037A20F2|nr:S-layer homology domain-containing protein [Salsuginibacillus kocurii]